MNIITAIKAAIAAFGYDADVFLYSRSRDENNTLEYDKPVIVVFPDWNTKTELNQGLELNKTRVYNLDFKKQDEIDNSDDDNTKCYDGVTSVDIIEEMETLADSVFSFIAVHSDDYNITEQPKWSAPEPILRQNSGTMSGVRCRLTVKFKGSRICPTT